MNEDDLKEEIQRLRQDLEILRGEAYVIGLLLSETMAQLPNPMQPMQQLLPKIDHIAASGRSRIEPDLLRTAANRLWRAWQEA